MADNQNGLSAGDDVRLLEPRAGVAAPGDDAVRIAGHDTDYAQRDLFNAIAGGNSPKWEV